MRFRTSRGALPEINTWQPVSFHTQTVCNMRWVNGIPNAPPGCRQSKTN